MCLRHDLLVEAYKPVDGALADLQGREVGEEIVPHKEAHEHPVIDRSLKEGGDVGG